MHQETQVRLQCNGKTCKMLKFKHKEREAERKNKNHQPAAVSIKIAFAKTSESGIPT